MTGAALAERLAAHGLPPAEREPKRRLFEGIVASFERSFGGAPAEAWWVPGRLEVFGKHTDYAGGRSLICAVPRGLGFAMRPCDERIVSLHDAVRNESHRIDASHPDARPGIEPAGWRKYVQVVVRRLLRNFPGCSLGAEIVFASDLPSASGMSSSSALLTGVAATLVHRGALRQRPEWQANITGPEDEAGYYACIENGMTFGSLAGDSGVGTHGGSEDHAAIVCGRAGALAAWRFVPVEFLGSAALPPGWTFVVASSGVAARKTGPARESYNRLSREAAALLALWRENGPDAPSLRHALTSEPAAAERLVELLHRRAPETPPAERLERRLRQFVREDARVLDALHAVRQGDARRLGELAAASQHDAELLLDNQVPETAMLAGAAPRLGALAASSFGAGFGGSVWALVEEGDAAAFADRWMHEYRVRFPDRAAALAFVAPPGPGIARVG